jgi:hypothetical protein
MKDFGHIMHITHRKEENTFVVPGKTGMKVGAYFVNYVHFVARPVSVSIRVNPW